MVFIERVIDDDRSGVIPGQSLASSIRQKGPRIAIADKFYAVLIIRCGVPNTKAGVTNAVPIIV